MKASLFIPGDDGDVTFELHDGPEFVFNCNYGSSMNLDDLIGRTGVLKYLGTEFEAEITRYEIVSDGWRKKAQIFARLGRRRLNEDIG